MRYVFLPQLLAIVHVSLSVNVLSFCFLLAWYLHSRCPLVSFVIQISALTFNAKMEVDVWVAVNHSPLTVNLQTARCFLVQLIWLGVILTANSDNCEELCSLVFIFLQKEDTGMVHVWTDMGGAWVCKNSSQLYVDGKGNDEELDIPLKTVGLFNGQMLTLLGGTDVWTFCLIMILLHHAELGWG